MKVEIAFSDGTRTWSESLDLVRVAAEVLQTHGYAVTSEKTWLRDRESGLILQPQLVELQPLDRGGVRTTTTIQVNHPTFLPGGLFEYQHATGATAAEAIAKGIDHWAQMDLVALTAALRDGSDSCTTLVFQFPARDGHPARIRRAVLGPVAHLQAEPPEDDADHPDAHPFCPCCLLTNSLESLKGLLERDGVVGLRLFASRDDGSPQADCRVNGEDFEPGAEALRAYAATWAPAGYEFRKQYVVLHSLDRPPAASPPGE